MNHFRKTISVSFSLLAAFILWTAAVSFMDVQVIGPEKTAVGFAQINQFVHSFTGVHLLLYTITDWLGLIPVGICTGFGILGLLQWIRRKHLLAVDADILILGIFYIIVIAAYLFFESFDINYRPVLIDGILEVSYPSSTTLLTMCAMPTAAMQFNSRIRNRALRRCILLSICAFTAFMVISRLASGVHWFTDIIGGIFLSAGLDTAYYAFIRLQVK